MVPVKLECSIFGSVSWDLRTVLEHETEYICNSHNTRSDLFETLKFCHITGLQFVDSLYSFLENGHDLGKFLITISLDLISGLLFLGGLFFLKGTISLFNFDSLSCFFDFNSLFTSLF